MDKKKRKRVILTVLIVILVIALLIVLGFFAVIFKLQNSGNLFEVQVTIDPEPVRDFIVDSFESLLPTN